MIFAVAAMFPSPPAGESLSRAERGNTGATATSMATTHVIADEVEQASEASQLVTRSARRRGLARSITMVFSFPAALVLLVALMVFLMARGGGVNDPDIWWHLRNAQYLLHHLSFPRVDMYSFTVNGHSWVNSEWLAEIPFYLAWHVWGLLGIKLVTILAEEGVILALFYLCTLSSGNVKASALAAALALFLAVVNFGPRTILFGYGCLLVLLIILERYRQRGRGPLWLLPPLFCLWANTHGSWLIGMAVFGIIIAGGLIEGKWGRVEAVRWPPRQLRRLLLAFGGSVAAVFANPYGAGLVLWSIEYPFRMKLGIAHVQEYMSVNFHDARGKIVLILLMGLLLAALLSNTRWKLTDLLLALFALYSGLTYVRFLFLAAILLAPLIAKFLDFLPPYQPEIDKPVLNGIIMAGVLAAGVFWFPSPSKLNNSLKKAYPAGVLHYLRSHEITGPIFNNYDWGGYLEWNDRQAKTFVDGRVDVFEDAGVLKDYFDATGIKNPIEVMDKYKIRYAMLSLQQPLVYLLKREVDWTVLYQGKSAVLFERSAPAPAGKAKGMRPIRSTASSREAAAN